MIGKMLLRGMLAGLLAGLLCFCFLKAFGEGAVDRAIAFETQMEAAKTQADAAKGAPMVMAEPELVSRATQSGLGLFTGVVIYASAFGGLFALGFAFFYRRWGNLSARATALMLSIGGFVAVYVVPSLKYPANPPSIGEAETIKIRTTLYFAMIVISLISLFGAALLRNRLQPRFGAWNAAILAGLAYVLAMVVVGLATPGVNEVPEGFPANVLWQFRIASFGAQMLMWLAIGLIFGGLTERAERLTATPAKLKAA